MRYYPCHDFDITFRKCMEKNSVSLPKLYKLDKSGSNRVWKVWTEGCIVHKKYGLKGHKLTVVSRTFGVLNAKGSNRREADEVARDKAKAAWVKYVDRGYKPNPEDEDGMEMYKSVMKQKKKQGGQNRNVNPSKTNQRSGNEEGGESSQEESDDETIIKPMLAVEFKKGRTKGVRALDWDGGVYVDPKFDGVRCVASLEGGKVKLTTRSGKTIPHLSGLKEHLKEFFDFSPNSSSDASSQDASSQDASSQDENDSPSKRANEGPSSKRANEGPSSKRANEGSSSKRAPSRGETQKRKGSSFGTKGGVLRLDGEVYIHSAEKDGQELSRVERYQLAVNATKLNRKLPHDDEDLLDFYVFDIVADGDQRERHRILKNLFKEREGLECLEKIKMTPRTHVKSENDALEIWSNYIADDYEGVVLRDHRLTYRQGVRASLLQKLKDEWKTEEFEVVGAKEAQGTEEGTVVWEMITEDGLRFWARPSGSFAQRQKYLQNWRRYKGRMGTVKYMEMGVDGRPRHPVFMSFRYDL